MLFIERAIIFFFFFLPFQVALSPAYNIDLASIRVFSIILFLLWFIQSMKTKKIFLPQPKYLFFFLAFFFLSLASFLWSENREWNIRKNMFFLSFIPLFFVCFSLLSKPSLKDKVVKYLLYSAFFSALFALCPFFLQFIYGTPIIFHFWIDTVLPFFLGQTFGNMVAQYPSLLVNISGHTLLRAVGFFPDPHMFSLFLGMVFPFSLVFLQKDGVQKRRKWFIIAITLLFTHLFTFSRGGYIGMLFGSIIFCILFLVHHKISRTQLVRWSIGGIVFLIILLASPVGMRLASSFSQGDGSNRERIRLWKEAGSFILSHPFLGSGLGNYPLTVKPSAEYREPIYVHNLYLDIAGELGITGLFLFLGLIGLVFFSAFKKWYEHRDIYALAVCFSLAIFLFHSFFETAIFSVHILPLLLLFLALGIV